MQDEQRRSEKGVTPCIVGGILAGTVLLLCRGLGSPLQTLHRLAAYDLLPPIWMISLLWLLWLFALGTVTAYMLRHPKGGKEAEVKIWMGCTWLSLSLVCCVAWYTLLFVCFSLLLSWVFLCLSAVAICLTCLSWLRCYGGAGVVAGGYGLWLISAALLQLVIMLRM